MSNRNIKFIYSYLKKYITVWMSGIVLTAIAMLVKIKYSWLMKDLIDQALMPKDLNILLKLCITFPLLVLICSFITYLKEYCFNFVSQKSIIGIREDIFSHVLQLPYRFFVENDNGQIVNRLINDVENTQEAFSDSIVSFISSIITIVFVSVWLFFIHWKLAIIVLLIVPFFVIITKCLWKKIGMLSRNVSEKRGEITSFLQQTIISIELVKLVGNNHFFLHNFAIMCKKLSIDTVKLRMSRIFANSLWESILTPYQGVIYLVGGFWYITVGSPSIGTMLAFINYVNLLIPAMLNLIDDITNMSVGASSLERLYEYLDEEPQSSGEKLLSTESTINIEFKNVCFSHINTEFEINNLNLSIYDKDFVTIIGHTGSGKSTLLKLLVRMYDIDSGEILINGINIKEYNLNDLRMCFGFVQQEVHLLKGTIRTNLTFANPEITEEKIEYALRVAQLDKFVNNLPNKLDTIVGERGITLSGGERQRLSVARMILCKNKVVVMDEPTSALDMETEHIILKSLQPIFNQITTIVIDHRLSTLDYAKRIVVIEHGKIIEEGGYNELIAKNGKLCELLNCKKE